jgi:pimeloyl-ACP methyl ester carboxylesterase
MVDLVVRGARVFVHTGGVDLDASDGVVLMVHGAPDDHTVWRYQTRRLAAAGFPVAAVDLPAHSKSEGPPLGSVEEMADWMIDVVRALEAPWVTIVGHSMGSLIAVQAAATHPEMVRGIFLVAPSEKMAVHPDLLDAAERHDRLAADLIVGWTHTGSGRFGPHDDPGVWKPAATRRLIERNAGVLAGDLQACVDWDSIVAGDVRAPTMVVVGERDRMTPAKAGRALAEIIPGAEVAEIPSAGHPIHYTRPGVLNDLLTGWLERIGTPKRSGSVSG